MPRTCKNRFGDFFMIFAISFRIRNFMSHIDYRRRKEGAMDTKEILSELRNLYIAKSIIVPSENGIMEADDTVIIDKLFELYSDGYLNRSFENEFEMALEHKKALCSENTAVKYHADYKRFISGKLGEKLVHEITADYLIEYASEMIRSGELKKEAYRAFKSVRNLTFGFALTKGFVDYNPAQRMSNQDFYRLCKTEYKSAEQKAMSPQQIEDITEEVRRRIESPKK